MNRVAAVACLATLVLLLVGCDHATKSWAQSELAGSGPLTLVSGALDLRYAENRDVAFSLLRMIPAEVRRPLLLALGTAGVLLILGLWLVRRPPIGLESMAIALLLAGALGNLLDRFFRGYVVDFIHVHYWPIFNAADVYLTVGIALWLALQWRRQRAPT